MGEDLGHTVYRGPEGETTEWDDIQRRIGNLPPLPDAFKPEPWAPGEEKGRGCVAAGSADAARELMNAKTERELEEMDEDTLADDRFLEQYRCGRRRQRRLRFSSRVTACRRAPRRTISLHAQPLFTKNQREP